MKIAGGLYTALITPFKNGELDEASLKRLVDRQIKSGVEGFVINGTTGESPTINQKEREKIFAIVRDIVGQKTPLIMGTGSNSTEKTIADTKRAKDLGADAALVVVPYYNKPPQRGLYQHFKIISEKVDMPILLYNVPGRTVASLQAQTVSDLSQCRGIIGIKEATGDIALAKEIKAKSNKEFLLFSGDDGTYVEFLLAGGHGVISVASHIIPEEMKKWRQLVTDGKIEEARTDIKKYAQLIDLLFVEANPIPVKAALQIMGIIESAELRLPLVELDEKNKEKLKNELKNAGVLK